MAPVKARSGPSKGGNKRSSKPSKPSSKSSSKSSSSSSSRAKKPSGIVKAKTTQQKTKSTPHGPQRKKKRVYTDKELNIPALNSIKPAGIQKPHGVKKGKTFVDDRESMMAILAMVQADKEGNIESKMIRARQMEEIREARKAELEKKEGVRKQKLEDTKDEIRKSKKKHRSSDSAVLSQSRDDKANAGKPPKKRVSFG